MLMSSYWHVFKPDASRNAMIDHLALIGFMLGACAALDSCHVMNSVTDFFQAGVRQICLRYSHAQHLEHVLQYSTVESSNAAAAYLFYTCSCLPDLLEFGTVLTTVVVSMATSCPKAVGCVKRVYAARLTGEQCMQSESSQHVSETFVTSY